MRWEYQFFRVLILEPKDEAAAALEQEHLNSQGNKGWEAVGFVPPRFVLMKRRKDEE